MCIEVKSIRCVDWEIYCILNRSNSYFSTISSRDSLFFADVSAGCSAAGLDAEYGVISMQLRSYLLSYLLSYLRNSACRTPPLGIGISRYNTYVLYFSIFLVSFPELSDNHFRCVRGPPFFFFCA